MIFFVYIDWTLEDVSRPFYVGKGQLKRISQHERNLYWRNIAAKHGQHREVVLATKDEAFAFEQEKRLIAELGTFEDGTSGRWGANLTEGGEGLSGYVHTHTTRQKISKAHLGKVLSRETRQKLSVIGSQRIGKKHPMHGKHFSEEACVNMSDSKQKLYASKRGAEIRQQIRETMTGRKLTEEHKRNVSLSRLGRKHSDETRRKLSEAAKLREARRRDSDG